METERIIMHGTSGWPIGVQPISLEDLENLGIDRDGLLYWAGKPMAMTQKLVLTWPQRIGLGLAAACAIMGGIGALVAVLLSGR